MHVPWTAFSGPLESLRTDPASVRISAQVFGPKAVTHVSTPIPALTLSMAQSGTNGVISNYNNLILYNADAPTIYGNFFQLATRLSVLEEACRNAGIVI